jgi:hypothetical protein
MSWWVGLYRAEGSVGSLAMVRCPSVRLTAGQAVVLPEACERIQHGLPLEALCLPMIKCGRVRVDPTVNVADINTQQ